MARRKLTADERRAGKDARDELKEARRKEKEERLDKGERLRAARDRCRETAQKATSDYKKAREKLKAWNKARRERVKEACSTGKAQAVAPYKQARKKKENALDRVREWQKRTYGHAPKTSTERRQELDDYTRANLPKSHWPLWEEVKSAFQRGTPDQRAERFMEYVEENPSAVLEAQERLTGASQRDLDRELAREAHAHYGRRAVEQGIAVEEFSPAAFELAAPKARKGKKKAPRPEGMFTDQELARGLEGHRRGGLLAPPPALALSAPPGRVSHRRDDDDDQEGIPF